MPRIEIKSDMLYLLLKSADVQFFWKTFILKQIIIFLRLLILQDTVVTDVDFDEEPPPKALDVPMLMQAASARQPEQAPG